HRRQRRNRTNGLQATPSQQDRSANRKSEESVHGLKPQRHPRPVKETRMSTAPAIPQTPLTLLEGPQTVQVFHDEKASKGRAQILHGSLEELQEKLQALNEAGYGIFFAVNQT